MQREITIGNLVSLPRMNGPSAVALAEQLLTAAEAAKGEGLPVLIERPRARLASAVSALKAALGPREIVDSRARIEADQKVDNAWRSLSVWLSAMASMPDGAYAEIDQVRTLNSMLFGEGLSFIALSFREEWTQSDMRLSAIADGGYEPVIEKLGGAMFLTSLKTAHTAYGEALGIKAPLKTEQNPAVRKYLDALLIAVKEYIIKAAAYAEPEESGSEALSQTLISPLALWKDTPSRSKTAADADAPSSDTTT